MGRVDKEWKANKNATVISVESRTLANVGMLSATSSASWSIYAHHLKFDQKRHRFDNSNETLMKNPVTSMS